MIVYNEFLNNIAIFSETTIGIQLQEVDPDFTRYHPLHLPILECNLSLDFDTNYWPSFPTVVLTTSLL